MAQGGILSEVYSKEVDADGMIGFRDEERHNPFEFDVAEDVLHISMLYLCGRWCGEYHDQYREGEIPDNGGEHSDGNPVVGFAGAGYTVFVGPAWGAFTGSF